jgi:enamine deaminase RidA (YjgF/YER057c/UK114 family)
MAALMDELRVAWHDPYLFVSGCRSSSLHAEAAIQADETWAALVDALEQRGAQPSDLLKLWILARDDSAAVAVRKQVAASGNDVSPVTNVIIADLPEGESIRLTAVAVRSDTLATFDYKGWWASDAPAASIRGGLFATGTIRPIDRSGSVPSTPDEQAKALFDNLRLTLGAADVSPESIAHIFVWYSDHAYRDIVNVPFLEMFPHRGNRPARHSVIRRLPEGEGLQLEAVGMVAGKRVNYTIADSWHLGIDDEVNSLPYGCGVGDLLMTGGCYGGDARGTSRLALDEQLNFAVRNVQTLLDASGRTLRDVGHLFVWTNDYAQAQLVTTWLERHLRDADAAPACTALTTKMPGLFDVQLEVMATRPTN